MTTTFTPNKNYSLPGTGDDVNSWGPVINANFSAIDSNISAQNIISTTGGTTTLTSAQGANVYFPITGALTSNAKIVFPGTATFFFAANQTTGSYTTTLSAAGGGASFVLAQGTSGVFWTDGTNIYQVGGAPVVTSIPSGTIMGSFLQASAPTGWTQVNTFNDQVIRVVNNTGTGGATGGSWTVSGFNDNPVALTIAQIPSHNHSVPGQILNGNGTNTANISVNSGSGAYYSSNSSGYTGGGQSHNHGVYNDGTWRPAYVNAIVCQKS